MGRVYITEELRRFDPLVKRALGMEQELFRRYSWRRTKQKGESIWDRATVDELDVLADAWEEADFYGWADNIRAAIKRRRGAAQRDPTARDRALVAYAYGIGLRIGHYSYVGHVSPRSTEARELAEARGDLRKLLAEHAGPRARLLQAAAGKGERDAREELAGAPTERHPQTAADRGRDSRPARGRTSRRDPSKEPPPSRLRLRTQRPRRAHRHETVDYFPYEVSFRTDDGRRRRMIIHAPGDAFVREAVGKRFLYDGVVLHPSDKSVRVRRLPFEQRDPTEPPPAPKSGRQLIRRAPEMERGYALARGVRQSDDAWEEAVVGVSLARVARFANFRKIDDVLHAVWTHGNMMYAQTAVGPRHPSHFTRDRRP